jgi:hypothetical protein
MSEKLNDKKEESNLPQRMMVCGITFTADQIITAEVRINGRKIKIGEKEEDKEQIGFKA